MITKHNSLFGEVVESSLTGFVAQCWEWHNHPRFGTVVCVESGNFTIFGVVHQIQTGSLDASRYPFTYQKTEEELRKEQPQIFEFLKTSFSCLPLGYEYNKKLVYAIAPEPVKIHAFVGSASLEQVKKIMRGHTYLHIVFGMQTHLFNLDELVLALLRFQLELNVIHQENVEAFMHTYCLLVGNDYSRIKLFAQRVETLL